MRTLFLTLMVALSAAPAAAQDFHRPDDWRIRFDQADATVDGPIEDRMGVDRGRAAAEVHRAERDR